MNKSMKHTVITKGWMKEQFIQKPLREFIINNGLIGFPFSEASHILSLESEIDDVVKEVYLGHQFELAVKTYVDPRYVNRDVRKARGGNKLVVDTYPNGSKLKYMYNSRGDVVKEVDPTLDKTTIIQRDEDGLIVSTTVNDEPCVTNTIENGKVIESRWEEYNELVLYKYKEKNGKLGDIVEIDLDNDTFVIFDYIHSPDKLIVLITKINSGGSTCLGITSIPTDWKEFR